MSFFRALFDFSFSEFVTTKIIKFLYVVTIILAALVWVGFLIAMFASDSGIWGILAGIIGAPIGFFLQVVFTRVGYEILMVVFGIAEHTRDMAFALTGGRKAPVAQPQYPQQPPPQAPRQYAPPQPQYPPAQQQYTPPQPPTQQPQQPPQYPQYPQYPQQPPQQPPAGPQYPPPQQPKP